MSDRPKLDCPECGVPLIPAHGRGRFNDDGEYVVHRDGCRCHWCQWVWFDDMDPVKCACGAAVVVDIDDKSASAKFVRFETTPCLK
jgi:hypothetical protein